MRKKMPWEWEKLDEGSYRAKVIGGWVLKCFRASFSGSEARAMSESMIFISDRDHEWTIVTAPTLVEITSEDIAKDFANDDVTE